MRLLALLLFLGVFAGLVPAAQAIDDAPRDLQQIIDDAAPGSTVVLEAGTYAGGVTIDKPLTITGGTSSVIDGGGRGTVITVDALDVTIEGVVVRNSGASLDREDSGISVLAPRVTIRNNQFEDVLFGIFLRTAPDSVVADNVIGAKDVYIANRGDGIRLWESERSVVQGNVISGGRDTVFWFTNEVVVRDNEVTDGRYGLHFMYSDGAMIERNILSGNSVGAFMMYSRDVIVRDNIMAENFGPSGYGLGLKDMDRVTAEGNRFVGNRVGMYFDNSPYTYGEHQYITNNLIAYNDTGVLLQPSVERNVFAANAFIDNGEQVGVAGSGEFSGNEWSMAGSGNYWSDFAGYDADNDGVGDVPYRLEDLYSTLTDQHQELTFFSETPAAKAVDLAARMFPVLKPRPKVEDPYPLTRAPEFKPLPTMDSGSLSVSLLGASVALLAGAAMIIMVPTRRRRGGNGEVAA